MDLGDGALAEQVGGAARGPQVVAISLEDDIRKWINERNKNPRPFTWTKRASPDDILETLAA